MSRKRLSVVLLFLVAPAVLAGSLGDALTGGKAAGDLRYRFEWVDQSLADNAEAHTVRLRLGYRTGLYHGFSAFGEFEGLRALGSESYNSTANGKMQFPVVPDPEDEEVNQLYLDYTGIDHLTVRLGRQRIIQDNARFIGNVGWRQNEQTYDAASVTYDPGERWDVSVTHINNVNRIFGEHHPVPARADTNLNGQLVRGSFTCKAGQAVGYVHLLEFEDAPAVSHRNVGLRFTGDTKLSDDFKLLYGAELADQADHADAPSTVDADYLWLELGLTAGKVTVKLGQEQLSGDGVYAFQTPLATLHRFNGWTDQFVPGTPAAGLDDLYLEVSGKVGGVALGAVWHDFSADTGGADYGTEWGVRAAKTFRKRYSLGLKYGSYDADTFSVDTDKLWIEGGLKF